MDPRSRCLILLNFGRSSCIVLLASCLDEHRALLWVICGCLNFVARSCCCLYLPGGGKSGSSGPSLGTSSTPWTSSSLNASGASTSSSTPPGPWVTLGGNRNSVASMLKAAGAPLPGAPLSSTLPLGGTSSGSVSSAAGGEGSGAGGKKGKGKGTVLFSTGSNQRKF